MEKTQQIKSPNNLHTDCNIKSPEKVSVSILFIVPQLDKCLKFKSVREDKNDCTLYKITNEMPYILDIYPAVALHILWRRKFFK